MTINDTNAKGMTMNGFKILGMAEEGKCDHCGANCPKRRVYVMPVDADGNHDGDVQCWGVICASKVRHRGSKAVRHQSAIVAEAQRADSDREYHARQKACRVVECVPYAIDLGFNKFRMEDNPQAAANCLYRMTNRPRIGSYFAENAAGHIVRVDGTDAADVEFYAARGFVQITATVAA
jgi:hypothetical protein